MPDWNGYELPRILVPSLCDLLGISRAKVRHEVARGRWTLVARGAVLTATGKLIRPDWAALGVALAGPSAALSGWDASLVHGVAPRVPPSDQVLVLSRHSSNRVVGCVRIRETTIPYVSRLQSFAADYPLTPVVEPVRAVVDTALLYEQLDPVRVMVTRSIQRGVVDVPRLLAQASCAPRQGSLFLRLALEDARAGAHSIAEAKAADRLRRGRLPEFELNASIYDANGREVAVADVLWRELSAILEIDSREYHYSERDWKATMARHNMLTALGFSVTHYPPSIVMGRSTAWVDDVRDWLDQRRLVVARAAVSRR